MLLTILFITLYVISLFFIHTFLHELSHVVAAKLLFNADIKTFKPYPHFIDKSFVFGSISYTLKDYDFSETHQRKLGWVYFAPRIINVVCAILLPIVVLVMPWNLWGLIAVLFFITNLIDLVWGTAGINLNSDIQQYSKYLNIDINMLRVCQIVLFLFTIIFSIILLFIQ
jgi:hypothetical protein